jgi:hypothetical protein
MIPVPPRGQEAELAVLLLPEALERFSLRSQAEDLLRAQGVVAVDPPRLSYAATARLPELAGELLASRQGHRLLRALRRAGRPRVVIMFKPVQYLLARALVAHAGEPVELWYWRAGDPATGEVPRTDQRERLDTLDDLAAERATLAIVESEEQARIERAGGRAAVVVPCVPGGAGAREIRALDDPVWQSLGQTGVDLRVTR